MFKKLNWELEQLKVKPWDSYIACNFFVTAWYLLEWKYPDNKDKAKNDIALACRKSTLEKSDLLKACEFLAVITKHYSSTRDRIIDYATTCERRVWETANNNERVLNKEILIKYKSDGSKKDVVALAQEVVEYWKNNLYS